MKNSRLIIAALVAVFCTQFVNANEVRFENVSIEYDNGLPILVGKVKRSSYNSKVLPGHVDYIIKSSNGVVIGKGGIQYSPSLSLRRWKFGSSFSAALPENLPADAVIQVGFHRNEHQPQKYSPIASHTENKLL